MNWKQGWPRELGDLLDQVVARLGVDALYFEAEISGLSGARTFRARTDMPEGIGRRVVLKVGDPGQIEDEIRRYNDAKNHFGAHPSMDDWADEGGTPSWFVMSVALDGLGATLRDRFDDLSADEIDRVIGQLFNRAVRLYEKTGFKRSCSAFGQYALRPDLIPNLRAIGDVPYTLVDWWEHAAVSDRQQSTEAFVHGDLHGGNVLLKGSGDSIEVSLIDFGLSGMGHAYRDLAKLERDLCLFVMSARDASVSERLSGIDEQLDEEDPTSGSERSSGDADIERAVRAIRQIRDLAKGFARPADGDHWRHEYDVALTAQFMFSAANPAVSKAKRRAALVRANTLRTRLIARSPALEPEADAVRQRELEDRAWKTAYSLLRLDQLPRGGWSRSLPQWMEAIWEGDHGTVFRSPAMKDNGGVDSTGYAAHLLCLFASRIYGDGHVPRLKIGFALQECAMALQERIGPHGGLDEGATSRGEPPPIKVRHTLVGLLVHLNCERMQVPGFAAGVVDLMVDYLISVIPSWAQDESHLFGMYASAVALWRVLDELHPNDAVPNNWSILKDCLNTHLPPMARLLGDVRYDPKPENTYPGPWVQDKRSASFFIPYCDLWRMERSNALMFLPLLLDETGSRFLREGELGHMVKERIGASLAHLLNEVAAGNNLSDGLIRYHDESDGRKEAPRDWGLSAELLRLLEMPVIQGLLPKAEEQQSTLDQTRSVLRRALHETLADYEEYHEAFRYTHGLSVGAYLSEQVARRVSPQQVKVLDEQITVARHELCSEQALHRLAQCVLTGRLVTKLDDRKGDSPTEAKMITELFVRTLAAGDHARGDHWTGESYNSTIAYFDSSKAKVNPAALSGDPIHNTLFFRLLHGFSSPKGHTPRVVDLGCGQGMAAKWLMDQGFDVTLVDGSKTMIASARKDFDGVAPGKAEFKEEDVREMDDYLDKDSFNLVIANAIFVHIAPMHAADLISKVYDVLKPGGRFFFNIKLRDHTLVSLDGRYFAYYSDLATPKSILRTVGFEVDEIALRENHRTCYGVPKEIRWANFYCWKPE